VVGDVNSTIACTLVAAKLGILSAHVEAGLRSFDRSMPEEINRILTDSIADFLFTTCPDASRNLEREGIPKERIYFVGNIMIDNLKRCRKEALKLRAYQKYGLKESNYALLALHRPSNVDDKRALLDIMSAVYEVSPKFP
jgi:UDP-N-acetylglucosamine 2-epimerase (non-hydrolysing)